MLLSIAIFSALSSCSGSVPVSEFSSAVSTKQASAQTTTFTKLTFQGTSKLSNGSVNSETEVAPSVFQVAWTENVPAFTPQADAAPNASSMLNTYAAQLVLDPTVVTSFESSNPTFNYGDTFRVKTNVEDSSTGETLTSTTTYEWNSDLLLTSVKGNVTAGSVERSSFEFTYTWATN